MIRKLLIANRGEIAVRVMRTAKRLGIRTVAVYSDADANALHTRTADEAIHIGPAAPAESYLVIQKIITAAKHVGADAIHPGYGFLSENADFARACAKADILFVGPNVRAIEVMGSKSASKDMMAAAGVPVSPGYQGEDQSLETFQAEAKAIGYPVLLKASAGGGGKGMRLVEKAKDLKAALASAKREAKSAFGDDRFLIEKFITTPRHVEVQVFGDTHGNIVHLFERDCTVQRRHQKVIEEAPAPNLPDKVRGALHESAIAAAKAVDYVGAGTVEFLYDGKDSVYFMEMNTRLQVEHPVTEMITGIDLVEWQLRIASGEALPLTQAEIECRGHAFEARIYAEVPEAGFMPSTGLITDMSLPDEGPAVRLDFGVEAGDEVTPNYDPMIGKLITYGDTREQARTQLELTLSQTHIAGPETNTAFLSRIASHKDFAAMKLDTGFIEAREADLLQRPEVRVEVIAAALVSHVAQRRLAISCDPWESVSGFRVNAPAVERLELDMYGSRQEARLLTQDGKTALIWQEERFAIDYQIAREGGIQLMVNGTQSNYRVTGSEAGLSVFQGPNRFDLNIWAPDYSESEAGGDLSAPMPGTITALIAEAGAAVSKGDVLLVMEAMKMEHAIEAPSDGTFIAHRFEVGDQLQQGDLLVDFEPA